MISSMSLGQKPFETLRRVARYYMDQGVPARDVRKMMDIFLIQCDPAASIPKWTDVIDAAISRASKYEAVTIDSIEITEEELKIIRSLKGRQLRRLAFTLLCLSKYWDAVTGSQSHWVNTKDSDIMRMANINTSIKRQSQMYHSLNEMGLIQFSRKVDNTNIRVCFAADGDVALKITDFRNIGYQYLKYYGEPYFECANCGVVTKYKDPGNSKSTRQQKYCASCAVKINMQQRVNSVMRARQRAAAE